MKRVLAAVFALLALALLVAACDDDDEAGETGTEATPPAATMPPDEEPAAGEATPIDFGEAPMGTFAERCQPSDETQFAGPEQVIDTSKTYVATIRTAKGDIVVELFSDVPITTNNFVFLACKGFYDGLSFHRVVPNFVAQGGDPAGDCTGGPGYVIPDEDDGDHGFDTGVISMAKSGPDTAGSQFFITYSPQPQLEPAFTVFGQVREGMDVLQQLTTRECGDPNAPPGDVIESVTVEER